MYTKDVDTTSITCLTQGILVAISGPMFAGKTTKLLGYARAAQSEGLRVLYIKASADNRYADCSIVSHAGDRTSKDDNVFLVRSHLSEATELIGTVDQIFIDEGHFYPDIAWVPDQWVQNLGKTVVVSGLFATHQREAFMSTA